MILLVLSFVAGVLTVLAPCILPLLPVIVGGSLGAAGETASKRKVFVIVGSLGLSVIAFTLLLKASTALISIPPYFWTWLSGGIVLLFGATLLFPGLWEKLPFLARVSADSNKLVGVGYQKKSFWGDVLIGAALGPVFSTCSPTYFIVLATVLPQNITLGVIYLLAYAAGLCLMLLLVGLLGQRLADRLGVVADSRGLFKRVLGVVFIFVGLVIITGWDKQIQIKLLDAGIYDITKIEQMLLELRGEDVTMCANGMCFGPDASALTSTSSIAAAANEAQKSIRYPKAPEITSPDGYVNTSGNPITIGEFKGKKVVLIDFWTYSCINCQRTIPYLKAWDEKYRDQGLQIIGLHTPEFAFERVQANVEKAVRDFGLKYPSVLDNAYGTWNAFGNSYWPRKYLIDIDGYIVYDHIGEGGYAETEKAIQAALAERADRLGGAMPSKDIAAPGGVVAVNHTAVGSPETYFGAWRNENFGNGTPGQTGSKMFTYTGNAEPNAFYLDGSWNVQSEFAQTALNETARLIYNYQAKNVYLVAGSSHKNIIEVEVQRDGKPLEKANAGIDVIFKDGKSYLQIGANTLYHVVGDTDYGQHIVEFITNSPGFQIYTFTFG
jgi:cytochrome c biogenesis protein CcdA/thiol-disulfide isomerase/thioredoxin